MYRSIPQLLQVKECVFRVVKLQLNARIRMLQIKPTAVLVVSVAHRNLRATHLRQTGQKLPLHFWKFARLNFIVLSTFVVAKFKEPLLADEIERQELIDERQIV